MLSIVFSFFKTAKLSNQYNKFSFYYILVEIVFIYCFSSWKEYDNPNSSLYFAIAKILFAKLLKRLILLSELKNGITNEAISCFIKNGKMCKFLWLFNHIVVNQS